MAAGFRDKEMEGYTNRGRVLKWARTRECDGVEMMARMDDGEESTLPVTVW